MLALVGFDLFMDFLYLLLEFLLQLVARVSLQFNWSVLQLVQLLLELLVQLLHGIQVIAKLIYVLERPIVVLLLVREVIHDLLDLACLRLVHQLLESFVMLVDLLLQMLKVSLLLLVLHRQLLLLFELLLSFIRGFVHVQHLALELLI